MNKVIEKEGQEIAGLRFIKIGDLGLIPRRLMEQVKGVVWTPEELYALWPMYEANPFNLLYALADADHLVRGFVWCSVIPLQKCLFVNTVSLDRELQGRDLVKKLIKPWLDELREKLGLPYLKMITTRPRACERLGFRRDRTVLMEG